MERASLEGCYWKRKLSKMTNNHINYIELKAKDLKAIKAFYSTTFGWEFTDYGPNYTAFKNAGIEGGFHTTDERIVNGALIVLYAYPFLYPK